ncbi:MAG: hypothetical protein FGF53_05755 [Candidatus Brockarchaeota archaeon]|nr:hypothetical protein [Candidatus Brockarchaeota archaeon]
MGKRQRVIVRWTAPKELVALTVFIATISLLEAILVAYFWSLGMTDFILLLLPLIGVMIALTFSWAYLTEQIAIVPQKAKAKEKRGRHSFFRLGKLSSMLPSGRTSWEITFRSTAIMVAAFLIPVGAIYILTSQWIVHFLTFLKPLVEIEVVWKYVLLQDVSAMIAGLFVLLMGRRRA